MSRNASSTAASRSVSVPPWMVFWLVTAVVATIPQQAGTWWAALQALLGVGSAYRSVMPGDWALRFVNVADLVPPLLILAAIAAVLAVPLRGRWVERTYALSATSTNPALQEITQFVHELAPRVEVRSRLVRTDGFAFSYSRGIDRPALAVLGGLVVLWRRDRAAAEAVIRHEVAHCRRGDTLLMGAVSPLDAILRRWVWLLVVFVVLPCAITWTAITRDFLHTVGPAGYGSVSAQLQDQVLPGVLLIGVTVTGQVLAAVVMPVAASWSAEFAADLEEPGTGALVDALTVPGSRRQAWLRARLTHPPRVLRRALARRAVPVRVGVAVAIYPVAWLLRLAALLVVAAAGDAQLGAPMSVIRTQWVAHVDVWAHTQWPVWLAAAALVIVWPPVGRRWAVGARNSAHGL